MFFNCLDLLWTIIDGYDLSQTTNILTLFFWPILLYPDLCPTYQIRPWWVLIRFIHLYYHLCL